MMPLTASRVYALGGNSSSVQTLLFVSERGDSRISAQWVRRTRIDGDHWDGFDVPVGKMREQYLIRLRDETDVKLELTVTGNTAVLDWPFSISGNLIFEVAQLLDRFGSGPFAQIAVT